MSHAHGEPRAHKPHVLPVKIYAAVWGGLLVLTVITVWVSYFDFGILNLLVAMAVASVKATLVVLFFMHLKYDEKFNVVVFAGCLAFLFTFFVFTLADTTERGKVDPLEARELKAVPARPELEAMVAGTHSNGTHPEGAPGEGAAPDSTHPGTPPDSTHPGTPPDSTHPGAPPDSTHPGAPSTQESMEDSGGVGAGH